MALKKKKKQKTLTLGTHTKLFDLKSSLVTFSLFPGLPRMRDTERTQPWPTPFLQSELVNFSLELVFHEFLWSHQNQRRK